MARILARHLGDSYYHKIGFTNEGKGEGDLWINGGVGYLVGPQVAVLSMPSVDLEISLNSKTCDRCEEEVSEDDTCATPSGETYCSQCYNDNVSTCSNCGDVFLDDDLEFSPSGDWLCRDCYDLLVTCCDDCGSDIYIENATAVKDSSYCPDCFVNKFKECDSCNEIILTGDDRCEDCATEESEAVV